MICEIKSGDTLGKIAAKYGLSVSDIVQANPGIIDPNMIHIGESIVIPERNYGRITNRTIGTSTQGGRIPGICGLFEFTTTAIDALSVFPKHQHQLQSTTLDANSTKENDSSTLSASKKIVKLCNTYWERHKKNCSGYVKDVAKDLGITLIGQANDIVDQIQKTPWISIKSGMEAKLKAERGMFVVGGLKAKPNGHVVIVVPGPLNHGKYPTAYWGSLGGVPKKNTTINWSWNESDRDSVIYAYRAPLK